MCQFLSLEKIWEDLENIWNTKSEPSRSDKTAMISFKFFHRIFKCELQTLKYQSLSWSYENVEILLQGRLEIIFKGRFWCRDSAVWQM